MRLCRNDRCVDAVFLPNTPAPPPDGLSASSFLIPGSINGGEPVTAQLWSQGQDRFWVSLDWAPARLDDGDRYTVTLVDRTGAQQLLLDQQVAYPDSSVGAPGAPCYLQCKFLYLDLRGQSPATARPDRGDKGCNPAPLSEACASPFGCPNDKQAAVVAVCENPQGSGYREEGPNGCGGWTVKSTGPVVVSVTYDFDAAGKLAGVTSWDDVPEKCETIYGAPCKQPGGSSTTQECPRP